MIKVITVLMIVLIMLVMFALQTDIVYAFGADADKEEIIKQLDVYDFSRLEKAVEKKDSPLKFSFRELVTKAVTGELKFSIGGITGWFLETLFKEIFLSSRLIKELLIIALLSALLKVLTESFKSKAVGELGFYVTYIALVAVTFSAFNVGAGMLGDITDNITSVMQASMPLMVSLLVMSGNVSGALVFQPVIVIAINVITAFIVNLMIPIIILAAAMQIINYLTEKEALKRMSDMIKKVSGLTMKGIVFLFVAILTLQRISAPILNNLTLKTARAMGNAIPIVGNMLTGAMDTVINFTAAAKSGSMVAIVLSVILICALPLIKLLALVIIYKFTAAIIEPVCDSRIVKCIDSIGSFSILLLEAGVIVIVMFLFAVMIMLSF